MKFTRSVKIEFHKIFCIPPTNIKPSALIRRILIIKKNNLYDLKFEHTVPTKSFESILNTSSNADLYRSHFLIEKFSP